MAASIPDHIIDRIRNATDIVSLVRETVPLRKAGVAFKGLCPFHREKTPSFHVNPERQIFKCFGCGQGGDVFSWIMKTENVGFTEAIVTLAERAHIELPQTASSGPPAGEKDRLYKVNAWAAEAFHRWLLEYEAGAAALNYARGRSLSEETIKKFQLGFSPDSWDALLKSAQKRKIPEDWLAAAGLLSSSERADRRYDRFRNRLMFPIRDPRGRVIGFGARALDNSEPKYLNSPETPLFSKGQVLYAIDVAAPHLREKRQAIVVEGYMDAIAAHQHGIPWTVGVLGTALTREHVRVLRRYVDEAVLLFDMDEAGRTSAHRSVDAFVVEELAVRVARIPEGKDPDEFLRARGAEAFLQHIDAAVDGMTYKLDRALETAAAAGDSSLARSKALDDVLATVALMPNPVTQSEELRRISARARIPEAALLRRLADLRSRSVAPRDEAPQESPPDGAPESEALRDPERELLETVVQHPDLAHVARENLHPELLRDAEVRLLLRRFLDLSEAGGPVAAEDLLARCREERERRLAEALIRLEPKRVSDPEKLCRELIAAIEARAHREEAQRHHERVLQGATRGGEDVRAALRARQAALQEAHRKRGKFALKSSAG